MTDPRTGPSVPPSRIEAAPLAASVPDASLAEASVSARAEAFGTDAGPAEASDAETPEAPLPDAEYAWAPPPAAEPRPLAGTALWLGIAGLGVSLFVGWGLPLAVGAFLVAFRALRRPWESRGTVAWAIGLAAASVVYSAGWLVWAVTRM